jgi:PAS domain S-box-containing protein
LIWENFHPSDIERIQKSVQRSAETLSKWNEEWRYIKPGGSMRWQSGIGIPSKGENDSIVWDSIILDITERKEAQQKLRESEKKYRRLFDKNPQPMYIFNPDTWDFVEVNQAAINHYGYSEEEFLGMTLADIRPPEGFKKLKNTIEKHRSRETYVGEWKHLKKDGSLIDVEVTATNIQYDDTTYRLALIHDVTDQKRMQEKIIQSVIEGENRERKRIAHELHDGIGQYLAAASMNFESMKRDIRKLPQKREQQFKTGLSLLQNALSETRSISYNLMPKAIADYGLITAIENLIQNLQKSTDIIFNFDCNKEELELNDQAEINIYRIIQEIISNSVRHADCSTISIELKVNRNSIKLIVEDDGKGISVEEKHSDKGLGLRSIKTRVSNLQGAFDINSQPGKGMTTTITIPHLQTLLNNNKDNG